MFRILQDIPEDVLLGINTNLDSKDQNHDGRIPKNLLMKINSIKGELGQMICVYDYLEEGFTLIPTGRGSDYYAVKIPQEIIDKLNGTLIETKTGQSSLSKEQRRVKNNSRKQNDDYRVYRVSDAYLKKFIQSLLILIPFLESKEVEQE